MTCKLSAKRYAKRGKPIPAPLLNPHTTPPPHFLFLLLFKKIVAVENKYSVLDLPGNKFSG